MSKTCELKLKLEEGNENSINEPYATGDNHSYEIGFNNFPGTDASEKQVHKKKLSTI